MVVLAMVVLLGAVLIIAGKVLPRGHESARATPTPGATVSAGATVQVSSTPRPSPTPRPLLEVTLLPGTPPAPSAQPTYPFNGWVRARVDVQIHGDHSLNSSVSGLLAAGSLAYAYEDQQAPGDLGWLNLQNPGSSGWIATTPDGSSLVERLAPAAVPIGGEIYSLTSGTNGYIALAAQPGRSDRGSPTFPAGSSDGSHWRTGTLPPASWGTIASGPAGWVSFSMDESSTTRQMWIWNSADGLTWEVLGAWVNPGYANQLIGSARGYLLTTQSDQSNRVTMWFSPDAITWNEVADPGLGGGWLTVAATTLGFYAWGPGPGPATTANAAAFSADGTHWSLVDGGPRASSALVGSIGNRMLAIDRDPASGSAQVWMGSVVNGSLQWSRDATQDQVFAGSAVSALASDGQRMAAFGWGMTGEEPRAWIRSGGTWTRSPLPASFKGIPRIAAAGPRGFVVVGYRPTLRGGNPIIWHQASGGTWAPEGDPLVGVVPDPLPGDCAPPPRDALAFTLLDRASIPVCLGDTPLTFRAWSSSCDGCTYELSGRRRPQWLAEPGEQQLQLSPVEGGGGGQAVLPPTLPLNPQWANHWVELTGHFGDPAAFSCEWTPGPEELAYYSGRQDVVNGCLTTFVVTAVRLVDGP